MFDTVTIEEQQAVDEGVIFPSTYFNIAAIAINPVAWFKVLENDEPVHLPEERWSALQSRGAAPMHEE